MSEGCRGCGFPGGSDLEHIEHAHRIIADLKSRMAFEQGRHQAAIGVLQGQKKNRLLLGMSNEILELRTKLQQCRLQLAAATEFRKDALAYGKGPAG